MTEPRGINKDWDEWIRAITEAQRAKRIRDDIEYFRPQLEREGKGAIVSAMARKYAPTGRTSVSWEGG